MKPKPAMLVLVLLCMQPAAPLSTPTTTTEQLRAAHRSERLNLLNHPLQIQLATGALPYGSFVRLCHDRSMILDAVRSAAAAAGVEVLEDVSESEAKAWLETAEASGKTISTGDPSIKCYACGGDHLNVDCPDDLTVTGPARAVAAVLRSYNDVEAAAGVLAACEYGWACGTLLEAGFGDTPYAGWLTHHAEALATASAAVAPLVDAADRESVDAAYVAALSALFNFVDSEASTAGLKGAGADLEYARRKLDALEPGFLDSQDRNANFVAATLKAQVEKSSAGAKKMDAAAAYLAAKKAKGG